MNPSEFYIIAKEPGAENPSIPAWANHSGNPASLASQYQGDIRCIPVDDIPGAFQLTNVLDPRECGRFIDLAEELGFLEDAAVSLPRSIRHNDSMTWVVDEQTSELIWRRCAPSMNVHEALFFHKRALGLNNRFRFYRYRRGDYFSLHTDGSWPGSRVINGKLVENGFPDRWSQLTFLLFLNDGYEGGRTQFHLRNEGGAPRHSNGRSIISVKTPMGGVLCFPHGAHPLHCLHGSEKIISGSKYIIRSDVLFEI